MTAGERSGLTGIEGQPRAQVRPGGPHLPVARPPAPQMPDLGAARLEADALVARGVVPCAVFGVADVHGSVLTHAASASSLAVDERSVFFLASVTKPIVATAVLRYVDEGRLDLRAPLARLIPELRGGAAEAVTAWHVLTHSSGLADTGLERLLQDRPSHEELMARVLSTVPDFPPGSRFRYGSSAWMLLAAAMARLSGRPFAEALRLRLLEPLDMRDTRFDPRHARRRVVPVHGLRLRNRVVEEVVIRFMARAALPGGGLFGTLTDLLAFGRSMLLTAVDRPGIRVITRPCLEEMTRCQTAQLNEILDDGTTRVPRYALGWGKPRPGWPGGPSAFTHGGAAGGRVWVDPDAGFAYAFLTSLWGAPEDPAFTVLRAVYGAYDAAAGGPSEGADRRQPADGFSMGTLTMEPHSVHEPS